TITQPAPEPPPAVTSALPPPVYAPIEAPRMPPPSTSAPQMSYPSYPAMQPPPSHTQAPLPPASKAAAPAAGGRKRILQAGGAFLGILALVAGGFFIARRPKNDIPAAPGKFHIKLTAQPAGAEIKVNGERCGQSACEMDLAEGSYLADAHLTGYRPATLSFTANKQTAASPLVLTLQPMAP